MAVSTSLRIPCSVTTVFVRDARVNGVGQPQVRDDHARAPRGQGSGRCRANSMIATCDQGDVVAEIARIHAERS
jgi:hypothetical protein